ncbi:MAG: alpha/beta hydrolase [Bryobacteraceae bacterium]
MILIARIADWSHVMGKLTNIEPRCLIIPGLGNSGARHWQSIWEDVRDDCHRVDLGAWHNPHRSHWVTKLDLAIAFQNQPVVLVAHSLGCLAVAWWVALAEPERKRQVVGALLVAPPDVERPGAHVALARFAPAPHSRFPFPAMVVASTDDRYSSIEESQRLARLWGADFHNAGASGHINADSFLGEWEEGQALLDGLIGGGRPQNQGRRSFPEGEAPRFKPTPRSH